MSATEQLQLTSLAALKRAIKVGTGLEVVATTQTHTLPDVGRVRRVEVVQGNAIAWRGVWANGGREWKPDVLGWLYWPKRDDVVFPGDDTFTVTFGPGREVVYRVVPAES